MFLKKLTPRSLYTRFLLIIIIPIALLQIIITYVFFERHWDSVNRNMSFSLAGEIAMLIHEIRHTDKNEWPQIFETAKEYMNLHITFEAEKKNKAHTAYPQTI